MARIFFISNGIFENLGIEYLSSYLKLRGHVTGLAIDPMFFQDNFFACTGMARHLDRTRHILAAAAAFRPDIVCFSAVSDNYQRALRLARAIRHDSKALIVFGGIHPTLEPAAVISEPCVDAVCVGEGEKPLAELAEAADQGRPAREGTPGLRTKAWSGDAGSGPTEPAELDALPFPDKELFYEYNPVYRRTYMAVTGRGCRFDCSYCSNHAMRRIYGAGHLRQRTPGNVVREISLAKRKYSPEFVWFVDDMFFHDELWLEEFCARYRQDAGLPFFCYLHPGSVTRSAARMLREAGCHEAGIGVQSINPEAKAHVSRNESSGTVAKALAILKEHGILSVTENIAGLPRSSHRDLLALAAFYSTNPPDLAIMNWLRLYPGTDLLESEARRHMGLPLKDLITAGMSTDLGWKLNSPEPLLTRKAAAMVESSAYLPGCATRTLINTGIWRLLPSWLTRTLNLLARTIKASPAAGLFGARPLYDSGARVYLGSLVHYARNQRTTGPA